jgi:hypothetical protein
VSAGPAPAPVYDPDRGTLLCDDACFAALIAEGTAIDEHAAGPLPAALRAIAGAVWRVTVVDGARTAHGWADRTTLALRIPLAGDPRSQLRAMPVGKAGEAFARLVGLESEGDDRVARAARTYAPGDLAVLLAGGSSDPAVGAVRAHWRVDADGPERRVVEAVSTSAGVWRVEPAGAEVLLAPATAAELGARLDALVV